VFFPELTDLPARPTNLPSGVPLVHQLLLGPPTVFDLEPLEPKAFEARYRISVRVAEELAERRILIPNLWARTPAAWKPEHQHLAGLVKLAQVNGERVDTYFRTRNHRYDKLIEAHTDMLKKLIVPIAKMNPARVEDLVKSSRSRTQKEMPKIIGTRWAYLDVLAPHASEYVSQLVADGKLEEASDFIRVTKHVYVSPISAAIGGNFTWGPNDIARLETIGSSLAEPIRFSRETHYFQKPERLEFLIQHITGVPRIRVLADCEAQTIVQTLENRELAETKDLFFKTMDVMSKLAQKGEVKTGQVTDWVRLHKEIRRQIRSLQKLGRFGVNATVGVAVGTYVNPLLGVGAGIITTALTREFVGNVGATILSFGKPDRHRFFHLLERIKGKPRE